MQSVKELDDGFMTGSGWRRAMGWGRLRVGHIDAPPPSLKVKLSSLLGNAF